MESRTTLANEYDILSRAGRLRLNTVPIHVQENLNPKFTIRPYQKEALLRWFDRYESTQPSEQPLQLLFNMATGSGKTLIMAALIIDLYKRGYSNFIFFVDKNNIVEKTKDNFLNAGSSKYLFNERLVIDGRPITVTQVSNFEGVSSKDINIMFTTTAGLHSTLNNPAENKVTYEDLAKDKLVLISDEAHHINSETKATRTSSARPNLRSTCLRQTRLESRFQALPVGLEAVVSLAQCYCCLRVRCVPPESRSSVLKLGRRSLCSVS